MVILFPCVKTITSEVLVQLLDENIFKRRGIPTDNISDRGKVFLSSTWSKRLSALGVKAKNSTAYHPQTDGESERTIQTILGYIRARMMTQGVTWLDALNDAAKSYNSMIHSATSYAPYEIVLGYIPSNEFGKYIYIDEPISIIHQKVRIKLEKQRNTMAKFANRKRLETPGYNPGDFAYLSTRNLFQPNGPNKTFRRFEGPFCVESCVTPVAFRLIMPEPYTVLNKINTSGNLKRRSS
ncbi:unnamed protein product [Rotaria socialis]|uniref:Integrase catalytic domain-containing protein n=1 Tax=Rotaria socialis TaxID=392032 RepID=A0A819BLL1_9BILA|nr:unnamed protein product [Rotaria socialis]CAF4942668.1 unnamed protein product [Rotaria socialis]